MVREKGLQWRANIPARLPAVMGDRTRLQQVVLNLISNAVKFTERGGISLWAESGQGRSVGRGQRYRHRNPRRRARGHLRRIPALGAHVPAAGYGGMGLGLAISRRLVELHGGKIGVISSGADGGRARPSTSPCRSSNGRTRPTQRPTAGWDVVLLLTERSRTAGDAGSVHLVGRGFQVETLVVRDGENWTRADHGCATRRRRPRLMSRPPKRLARDAGAEAQPGTRDIPVLFYSLARGSERRARCLRSTTSPSRSAAMSARPVRSAARASTGVGEHAQHHPDRGR